MKVLAALSGGVDSAVAAARAVEAGHEVTAVHLALSANPTSFRSGARGCCTLEDARDARRAADLLGVPFYVWDLAERFRADVVDDFVAEYAAGRTPNPCLRCNESIKFAAVLDRARALGFDAVCTGHYARIDDGPQGRELHRAVDMAKDQSYVLGVLDVDQLSGALFPLGDSLKTDVRAEAARRGLAGRGRSRTATTSASSRTATPPGSCVPASATHRARSWTATGVVVGAHDGAFAFTVGQRKGLRIDRPAPDGRPRYVLDISPVDRTVRGRQPRRARCQLDGRRPPALVRAGPGRSAASAGRSCARTARRSPPLAEVTPDGRLAVSLTEPGAGGRSGAGGGALRRHPGRRLGHHRRDRLASVSQPSVDAGAVGPGT